MKLWKIIKKSRWKNSSDFNEWYYCVFKVRCLECVDSISSNWTNAAENRIAIPKQKVKYCNIAFFKEEVFVKFLKKNIFLGSQIPPYALKGGSTPPNNANNVISKDIIV